MEQPPPSSGEWDTLTPEQQRAEVMRVRAACEQYSKPKDRPRVALPDRYALFASPLLRRPAADEPNKSDTI